MEKALRGIQELGIELPLWKGQDSLWEGTSCQKLDGKKLSQTLLTQLKQIHLSRKQPPKLVVVLVGKDPASQVYVANKEKACQSAGVETQTYRCDPEEWNQNRLLDLIGALNQDPSVHGILVQLPLPGGFDPQVIMDAIHPTKDVDGFLAQNLGMLAQGRSEGFLSCTPFGIMVLLASYGISLASKHVVVAGRSNIVGKPMGLLALMENATLTLVHSHTRQLELHTNQAEIVICAIGKPEFFGPKHFKEGAIVVDVGIHRKPDGSGKLTGDVSGECVGKLGALTPVPGGVGPMTIAMLCLNTALAARRLA